MVFKRGSVDRSSYRRRHKFSSKGQVTIFIIVGIILLFTFAAIMFFSKSVVTQSLEAELEPVIAEVPQTFRPINAYTESCIQRIGKRGLLILGQQGGYIYPDLVGRYSLSDPTEADGLNLEPIKVPYWHYNGQPNNGGLVTFNSLRPKLYASEDGEMSVESQLARFVEEKIDACLDGYKSFREQGFKIKSSPINEVTVRVSDSGVNFLLNKHIDAGKGKASVNMNKFLVKIPLRLKSYYDLANNITTMEFKYHFLEKQAMDLVHIFSGLRVDKLPPTSGAGFELFPSTFWPVAEAKRKVQELLTSYVPLIRMANSNNFYLYQFPVSELSNLYQGTTDQMVLPDAQAAGVNVQFDYFGWPIYFKLNTDENFMRPTHYVANYMGFSFGLQHYDARYDFSYPVLVTLQDPNAFDGEGYSMNFAMESNIRNNVFADNDQEVAQPIVLRAEGMACDDDKQDSEIVRTVFVDANTRDPLEEVQVSFNIPDQAVCQKGLSDSDGRFESKYTKVYGGLMTFLKEDYLAAFYPIDTYKLTEPTIVGFPAEDQETDVIELYPKRTINVTVKKKTLQKCMTLWQCSASEAGIYNNYACDFMEERFCFFNNNSGLSRATAEPVIEFLANSSFSGLQEYYFSNKAIELDKDEDVIIQLERVKGFNNDLFENEFQQSLRFSGDEFIEVDLYPGIYKLTLTLLSNDGLVIPKDSRCQEARTLIRESLDCTDIDEVNMDVYLEGIITWDREVTYVEITADDLYNSDLITFYGLAPDHSKLPNNLQSRITSDGTSTSDGVIADFVSGSFIFGVIGTVAEATQTNEAVIPVNSLVVEELALMGNITDIANKPDIRKKLEPRFT